MNKIRTIRLQTAQAFIARCLSETELGGILPPIRDIIRESGTTRAAVEQALEYYREKGELAIKPRSGIIKTEQPKIQRIIDLVACHEVHYAQEKSGDLYDTIKLLTDILSSNGYALRIHRAKADEPLKKYECIAELTDNSGYILLLPKIREIITTFERTGKPVVTLYPQSPLKNCFQVVDSHNTVRLQMKHLIGLGHSRILWLMRTQEPHGGHGVILDRQREYYQIMAENGFRIYPHWLARYHENTGPAFEEALSVIFSREPIPTALIVSDWTLPHLYRFLAGKNLVPGKDVSVVATDGTPVCYHVYPPATTVIHARDEAIENVWRMLHRQFSRNCLPPETIEVKIKLQLGLSTGPPLPAGHSEPHHRQPQ